MMHVVPMLTVLTLLAAITVLVILGTMVMGFKLQNHKVMGLFVKVNEEIRIEHRIKEPNTSNIILLSLM